MRRNPGFDGKMEHKIEDGVVTELAFVPEQVTDISPVRALTTLRKLDIHGPGGDRATLANIAPLKGLKLVQLNIGENKVSDLTPLREMPLEWLAVWTFRGTDLTPLKGMPLRWLNVGGGGQELDLTPLAGAPLNFLCINHTLVSNLTPLKGLPLTSVEFSNTKVTDFSPVRRIKTLETINMRPAAEFWERYDKGEFGKAADNSDPDRRAAEYVLSIGGAVRVDGNDSNIRAKGDLPAGAFQLTVVNLNGNKRVTDAGLAAFEGCTNLTQLTMHDCAQVTDAGFAHFKSCKGLAVIDLWGVSLTDAGLAHLKGNKKLTNLCLVGTQVTDAGLACLKECTSLAEMYLMGRPVTDAGLACLKDCKNLTWLQLEGTKVTDAGLAYLKDKNLTFLALERTEITDAGLAHLKDCNTLTQLWLRGTQVGDVGLAYFKDCKDLNTLNVRETKVSAAGIEALKKALPKCRIEWDGGVIEPTASLDPDRRAAEYVLSIGGGVRVDGNDSNIQAKGDLPAGAFQLTHVDLHSNNQVTDSGLSAFRGCKNFSDASRSRWVRSDHAGGRRWPGQLQGLQELDLLPR